MTKKKDNRADVGYTIKETAPGHLTATCNISGKPYIRANHLGMFCAENCECEVKSKEAHEKLLQIMKGLM
jgi:hypothetical protein